MHPKRDSGAKAWLLRIFRPGIRQKVALVLVTTLVVTLSVGGWRALHKQRQDIIQETHLRGTELAHVIAQSLVNSVVGYDYHTVELTLREMVKGEDIVYAKVLSPRGNVMAEIGAVPANDENFVLFEQTIRLNTETVGRLFLGLSLERITASLQKQREEFTHQELAIVLTIVLVEFLALSFLILRPIAAISRVMSQVRNDPETDAGTAPETKPDSSAAAPGDDPMALAEQLPSKSRDEIGDLARAFVRLQERTARAMNNLRRSEQKHRALVEAMPDAIFRLSRTGVFLDSKMPKNLAAAMLLADVSGKFVGEAFPPDVAGTLLRHLQQAFESGKTQVFYYPQETGDKNLYFEARVTISGEDEALVVVRDITEHRQMEEQIHTLAHYDSLTHLPNRLLFKQRLRDALAQAQRQGKSVAVMAMDLDHFKFVNDTLGHDNGDLLLQGVAERLQRSLRTSDYLARPAREGKGAILSRPGGDEFTILLTQIGDENDAARAARRVLEALAAPFRLTGHEIGINTSLGIALSPSDGTDPDTLIKNADAAMHHAKGEGRNTYRFFTQQMNATFSKRLTLGNYLRKALERDELALHYQPQVEIASGRVVGVESLLRWNHPELGAISPVEFIPLAEDTGLIVPIGEWVLRTACAQTRAWQESGLPALRVAVNLSGVQFRQPGLVAAVERALRESGLEPRFLDLELTEGILLRHDENVLRTLKELKTLGVQLSIDDFGTGYSSLSYLNRFPLDTLKIDRSFVRDIGAKTGDDAGAIASAIIAMAHSLKLQVVAEGVETDAQLAFLRQRGCDIMQGFLYSPPVPSETLPAAARGLPPPRRRANARH